jgi:hypothetical protein
LKTFMEMKRSGSKAYCSLYRLLLLIPCLFFFLCSSAQVKPPAEKNKDTDLPPPRNIKVLEEHKDAKGNTVRTIEYSQGTSRVRETIVIPADGNFYVHVPINPDTMNKDSVLVVVNKSRFKLEVYYRKKIIRSYKAVFGPKPLENKMMAGDRCTPEGWFMIQNKNPRSKYDKFMLLNYPDDSSIARFNRLKEKGNVPANARIGGDIGIHGIWPGGDDMIEKGVCWTDGCVAMKNKDIEELYNLVGVGTKVFIKK